MKVSAQNTRYRFLFVSSNDWANYLSTLLNKENPYPDLISCNYIKISPNFFFRSQLKLFQATHIIRVGIPPARLTLKNLIVDSILLPHLASASKKNICYWIGSDVNYIFPLENNRIVRKLRLAYLHLHKSIAGSPWLSDELNSYSIDCISSIFPYDIKFTKPKWEIHQILKVSMYIPNGKQNQYNNGLIEYLAQQCKWLEIHIYGSSKYWHDNSPMPENIVFHGWVSEPSTLISKCHVHIRYLAHDALGASVREALACSSHVIYTYDIPNTITVRYGDKEAVLQHLKDFHFKLINKELKPNHSGSSWVANNLSNKKLIKNLVDSCLTI